MINTTKSREGRNVHHNTTHSNKHNGKKCIIAYTQCIRVHEQYIIKYSKYIFFNYFSQWFSK